jgi:hypothetical protein
MKQITTLGLSLALAVGFASAVSAQTTSSTSTTSSAGVLTTTTSTSSATSSTTTVKKKPTSATADMVNEAIQRSQARAAKEAQTGTPQQWGSEEPFTYDPAVKNFTAQQQ